MTAATTRAASSVRHSALLVLGFNRPGLFGKLLELIKQWPGALYVAVDGPRPDHPEDGGKVEEVQRIARVATEGRDIRLRVNQENLGCGRAVFEAITWFFSHEPYGIILEDDCHPALSCLPFIDTMLRSCADDERIWMVSGYNHLGQWRAAECDYFYSDGAVWGWGTWRDRWLHCKRDLPPLGAEFRATLRRELGSAYSRQLLRGMEMTRRGHIDTWDYQWAFTRLAHRGVTVIPTRNLISNVGMGADATHGSVSVHPFLGSDTFKLEAPYREPIDQDIDSHYLDSLMKIHARENRRLRWTRLRHKLGGHG